MKSIFLIIGAVIVSVGVVWFGFGKQTPQTDAATPFTFGGMIEEVEYCCNGVAVTIGPPSPGVFMFDETSQLYSHYNIFSPGPNVVGSAIPGGVCKKLFFECFPSPTFGTIVQVGTSDL
ncbi:hypothetical protein IT398_01240 [Candidatus Nomurabacteria bacterium]|nr:hypothetical protein [Candidatus Nomurabacteria bacterium]